MRHTQRRTAEGTSDNIRMITHRRLPDQCWLYFGETEPAASKRSAGRHRIRCEGRALTGKGDRDQCDGRATVAPMAPDARTYRLSQTKDVRRGRRAGAPNLGGWLQLPGCCSWPRKMAVQPKAAVQRRFFAAGRHRRLDQNLRGYLRLAPRHADGTVAANLVGELSCGPTHPASGRGPHAEPALCGYLDTATRIHPRLRDAPIQSARRSGGAQRADNTRGRAHRSARLPQELMRAAYANSAGTASALWSPIHSAPVLMPPSGKT